LPALIGADPDRLEPGISKPGIGRFVDTRAVEGLQIKPVGRVESPLTERASAPRQGSEGAPEAWIVFEPDLVEALSGIAPGDEILVLTWLDRGDREVLQTRPRDDPANPLQGVFNTRSPDRPNPIGLHPVTVVAIEGSRMLVSELEALDGTPVIDVKPVI
jgi:tRNA-Thr(GGU) m(6)t(6)A37 methyltransferase TsaA